jgi:hypothetical protein
MKIRHHASHHLRLKPTLTYIGILFLFPLPHGFGDEKVVIPKISLELVSQPLLMSAADNFLQAEL